MASVLLVEDDPDFLELWADRYREHGLEVWRAESGPEALVLVDRLGLPDVVVADLHMPVMNGIELLSILKRRSPDLPVFLLTGYADVESAVMAMREGAEDYLSKDPDPALAVQRVLRVVEVRALRKEVELLRTASDHAAAQAGLLGHAPPMRELLVEVQAAARAEVPALIYGETGTGKEVVARAIHRLGPRASKPFVALNCAALPEDLVEGELFGRMQGAYTGATKDTPGLFRQADGGTIFLDELAEMPRGAQAKLLRVLEEGRLRAVGGTEEIQVDVRVIAATNRPFESLRGEFLRDDLYFRLVVLALRVPPLRDRREDVPLLADHFLRRVSARTGRKAPAIDPRALELLMAYDFPGNVRELENLMERALVTLPAGADSLGYGHLRSLRPFSGPEDGGIEQLFGKRAYSMDEVERFAIVRALTALKGNKSKAAEFLGISRDNLYRKLRRYKIPQDTGVSAGLASPGD